VFENPERVFRIPGDHLKEPKRSHVPTTKTTLLSISTCQRPYVEEIGRPNAAKYCLTLSDVKIPPGTRIMAAFLRNLAAGTGPGAIRGRYGPG